MNYDEATTLISNSSIRGKSAEYQNGFIAMRDRAMKLLNQVNEPQKVKVPQYVAEWILKCQELNWTLPNLFAPEAFESSFTRDTEEWLRQNKQNYDILAHAWLDGYEVEEEPRYYIQLPKTTWGTYLVKGEENELLVWQNTTCGTKFTEEEIKAIDERYWAFAVPAGKV